jgi:hypothetical protein
VAAHGRAARWLGGVLVVAFLEACSLLVDLDALGGADAAGGEGGSDAGGDVGGDASGDAGVSCVAPDFCDDFDQGALGAKWTNASVAGGQIALDTTAPVSPPNAFLATLDPSDGGSDRTALLVEDFPAATEIDCTFEVNVRQEGDARMRFFSIFVTNPEFAAYEMNVWIDPASTPSFEEWFIAVDGGQAVNSHPLPAFSTGSWTKVEVDVVYGNTVRVLVDGVLAGSVGAVAQAPQAEQLYFGARSTGIAGWSVLLDDLACHVVL